MKDHNLTRESLLSLSFKEFCKEGEEAVKKQWDNIAKPLDGFGEFERSIIKLGGITGTDDIRIQKPLLIAMCSDNGIVEEGISQSGQEVTALVAKNIADKTSSAGVMAKTTGCEVWSVDIGINSDKPIEGVLEYKVRRGTRNFMKEPAMTEEETLKAIFTGIGLVKKAKSEGFDMIVAGEMGIGNTTTSAAVAAALLGVSAEPVTGPGAGLSAAGVEKKKKVINDAIIQYDLYHQDALTVLSTVGGFDIAGIAGLCIGGAVYGMPVILDGVITAAAALAAEKICPGTKNFLIASHEGREPALKKILRMLDLTPVIGGGMALGEGSGGVMLLPLLQMVLSVYNGSNSFADITMDAYHRHEETKL